MKHLESTKALDHFLAKIGLSKYGANKLRKQVKLADSSGLFLFRMEKKRLLDRIKNLENDTFSQKDTKK